MGSPPQPNLHMPRRRERGLYPHDAGRRRGCRRDALSRLRIELAVAPGAVPQGGLRVLGCVRAPGGQRLGAAPAVEECNSEGVWAVGASPGGEAGGVGGQVRVSPRVEKLEGAGQRGGGLREGEGGCMSEWEGRRRQKVEGGGERGEDLRGGGGKGKASGGEKG